MNEAALKERLHSIAKQQGITLNECWKYFLLERFLVRLSESQFANNFVFKGGLLLSYLIDIGRETVDLDFLLKNLNAEIDTMQTILKTITATKTNDGFILHCEKIETLSHLHMNYPGYRITIDVRFGSLHDKIHIDLGVGDIVEPESLTIDLLQYRNKPIFEEQISLIVYPVETVFAEKLETLISRGSINSRMKDYHDLMLLMQHPKLLDLTKLQNTVTKTFVHRKTPLELPIEFNDVEITQLQSLWTKHLRGLGDIKNTLALPDNIADIIYALNKFLCDDQFSKMK